MGSGEPSVVEDHGLYASTCGYCKSSKRTSVAYGLLAHSLSVYDYQDLLNRGWRRSGKFLYRPEMQRTCCPAYTIRLRAHSFLKSKEQARVLQRMRRYLSGVYEGPGTGKDTVSQLKGSNKDCSSSIEAPKASFKDKKEDTIDRVDWVARNLLYAVERAVELCIASGDIPDMSAPKIVIQSVRSNSRRCIKASRGEVRYTCNVAFLCAATILKHNSGISSDNKLLKDISQQDLTVLLAERIAGKLQTTDGLQGLAVEACKGHLNFVFVTDNLNNHKNAGNSSTSNNARASELDSRPSSLTIKSEYGLPPQCGDLQGKRKRSLEVRIRRSAFDPEEFRLYKKYQVAVHHDRPEDVKESSYVRFLVDSPLKYVPPSEDGAPECGFGSFHQQYLIDGHLVAVGVVDILPCCLSSKYLFWDPDLAFLSLGKYSALQEIQWVQEANKSCPSLEFYYLGYYIHSCPKMRYKAAYCPSELLCPVRFKWVPFDIVFPFLEEQPYVCLSDCFDDTARKRLGEGLMKKKNSLYFMQEQEIDDETRDVGFTEVDSQQMLDDEVPSSSKESDDVSNVLLKLGNRYLQFKHLQALMAVPQKFIDALVGDLRKYRQVVGPTLAAKMAFALD